MKAAILTRPPVLTALQYNSAVSDTPRFLDDPELQNALDEISGSAFARLAMALPEINPHEHAIVTELKRNLSHILSHGIADQVPPMVYGPDAFGDRFDISTLPLARPGTGYAVQLLDTDTLLDKNTGNFLPVRSPTLDGLFSDFDSAYAAASHWLQQNNANRETHPLAIVPACFDTNLSRHVLIYGVLARAP